LKLKVKKGDTVKIIAGKDKGKQGKVLQVIPSAGKVVVEDINIIQRHTKPNQANPQGGIVEKPAPLAASNVMLICPGCNLPAKTGSTRDEQGAASRVCKRCQRTID
jgi:large subunit ribosomal protein L24